MLVEIHMLQNFAPSCLNRDDTNSPKDCLFGGYRRARISSQCQKRAIRESFLDDLGPETGIRSKRLHDELAKSFSKAGKPEDEITKVQANLYKTLGIKFDDKTQKSSYLLFLGTRELQSFAEHALDNWDFLVKDFGKKFNNEEKKELGVIKKGFLSLLDGGKAADIGLYGRMLADLPGKNIDGACQVSHAISTHKVAMEMDFYTAMDDLKPEDTAGADMMGTVDFNSACFYRYADIDFSELLKNLQGDQELAEKALHSFLEGAIRALPTGKQNSFAAHNLPSYIQIVVSNGREPWNLANAFVKPVSTSNSEFVQNSLVEKSIGALLRHQARVEKAFGREDAKTETFWLSIEEVKDSPGQESESVKQLLDQTLQAVRGLQ